MSGIYYNSFSQEYRNFLKKILYIVAVCLLISFIMCIVLMNDIARMSSYTYDDIEKVPYNRTGLVLGTSKYIAKGKINQYYINRINTAFELYYNGKIDYIVVSGDNAKKTYNEPRTMRADLLKLGIPAERIYLDYAGFRTLDSVVRIKHIFKQKSVTIISQGFHNERALYIARHNGIDAVGFNAPMPKDDFFVSHIREFFARIKCIFDVYVFNSQPKFLGDTIEIGKTVTAAKHAQMHSAEVPVVRQPVAKDDIVDETIGDNFEYNSKNAADAAGTSESHNPLTNDFQSHTGSIIIREDEPAENTSQEM